jgi:outer membrane receptor for ferrienterochelin and colicins
MFRSPDAYGYFTIAVHPLRSLTLSTTGTYTGSMLVTHTAGSGVSKDVAVNTPSFFDANFRVAYSFTIMSGVHAEAAAGVQNLFNAYQKDFDRGVNRDSDYIYGPSLPRSYFGSISLNI